MSKLKFRIGAKLAISAGVGVVLVGVMLTNQMMGGSSVASSNAAAIAQRTLSQIANDMKASARGMMLGVRDLRLAQTPKTSRKPWSWYRRAASPSRNMPAKP